MKNILSYLLMIGVLIATLSLMSCQKERTAPVAKAKEITFSLQTKAGAANNPEDKINTIRLYAYQTINNEYKLVGYYYNDFSAATSVNTSFSMKLPSDYTDIYAIVNEAAAGPLKLDNATQITLMGPTKPDTGTTSEVKYEFFTHIANLDKIIVRPNDLESLTFSQIPQAKCTTVGGESAIDSQNTFEYPSLPMTCIKKNVNFSSIRKVELKMKRSVAKLTMKFAKTGLNGRLFLGRGLFLYNIPEYGYLFPVKQFNGNIKYIENRNDKTGVDSKEYQNGGYTVLKSGWPDEPAPNSAVKPDITLFDKLDINEITAIVGSPSSGHALPQPDSYQQLPAQKPIYLFANPFAISNPLPGPDEITSNDKGYYLKILSHEHAKDQAGVVDHKGRQQRVSLPVVTENTEIVLTARISLDGFVYSDANWIVDPWQNAGGTITFD